MPSEPGSYLNAARPYYKWYEYKGQLTIESECCGDSFDEEQERAVLRYLKDKYEKE